MLPQLSAAVRVFVCTRPTDLRKGFDGLSGLVQECFSRDLLTGHLLKLPSLAPSLGTRFLAHLRALPDLSPLRSRQLGRRRLTSVRFLVRPQPSEPPHLGRVCPYDPSTLVPRQLPRGHVPRPSPPMDHDRLHAQFVRKLRKPPLASPRPF